MNDGIDPLELPRLEATARWVPTDLSRASWSADQPGDPVSTGFESPGKGRPDEAGGTGHRNVESRSVQLADRNGLHHPVSQVRLTVFGVGDEADQSVVAWGQLNLECPLSALLHDDNPAEWLRRWRPFQPAFGPAGKVLHLLTRD